MRFVPVKTSEQQSALMMRRASDLLVRQRTMLVNALRGHLAELGLIQAQGLHRVAGLTAIVMDDTDERVPRMARQVLKVIAGQIGELQGRIAALEAQILAWHKSNPVSQRLATIPGRSLQPRSWQRLQIQACSTVVGSLLHGSGSCRDSTPPEAGQGWVGSASGVTAISDVCWSVARTQCCLGRKRPRPTPG
jgi:hypothetical protein